MRQFNRVVVIKVENDAHLEEIFQEDNLQHNNINISDNCDKIEKTDFEELDFN